MYICGEVDLNDEYDGCNEDGIAVNQCCQDCPKVNVCKHHCDFAHDFGCLAKEKGDGVERRVIQPIQTNADRIRGMSDKELAEFLCHLDYSDDSIWNGEFWIDNGEELLKWLQSEAE